MMTRSSYIDASLSNRDYNYVSEHVHHVPISSSATIPTMSSAASSCDEYLTVFNFRNSLSKSCFGIMFFEYVVNFVFPYFSLKFLEF